MHFGCDFAQGYAIARPMPADEVAGWVESWRVPEEWATLARGGWSGEDFPLMLAAIHHARVMDRTLRRCNGEAVHRADSLDECRFHEWRRNAGATREARPGVASLCYLHDQAHALAEELVALSARDPEGARLRLRELQSIEQRFAAEIDRFTARTKLASA
jgi:hypothetical protein